jgi:hypothetical protein
MKCVKTLRETLTAVINIPADLLYFSKFTRDYSRRCVRPDNKLKTRRSDALWPYNNLKTKRLSYVIPWPHMIQYRTRPRLLCCLWISIRSSDNQIKNVAYRTDTCWLWTETKDVHNCKLKITLTLSLSEPLFRRHLFWNSLAQARGMMRWCVEHICAIIFWFSPWLQF